MIFKFILNKSSFIKSKIKKNYIYIINKKDLEFFIYIKNCQVYNFNKSYYYIKYKIEQKN